MEFSGKTVFLLPDEFWDGVTSVQGKSYNQTVLVNDTKLMKKKFKNATSSYMKLIFLGLKLRLSNIQFEDRIHIYIIYNYYIHIYIIYNIPKILDYTILFNPSLCCMADTACLLVCT